MGVTAAGPVVTIGNFDGVHVGHAALVRRARERAGTGGRVVAMVFDPHPRTRLTPGRAPPTIQGIERREALLRSLGVDEVVRLAPTDDLLGMSPAEFVGWVADRWGPTAWVEGADFRFGRGRAGDVSALRELGRSRGFGVEVVEPVEVALEDLTLVRASSSVARWLLAHGRVRDAARVLGRPHSISGVVVRGDRRGRELGFPTANVATSDLVPGDGVYAAVGRIAGVEWGGRVAAALSVGTKPTFDGRERAVEAHLLSVPRGSGGSASLPGLAEYGWSIELEVVGWVREQARFDDLDSLVGQIGRDCAAAARMAGEESVAAWASV